MDFLLSKLDTQAEGPELDCLSLAVNPSIIDITTADSDSETFVSETTVHRQSNAAKLKRSPNPNRLSKRQIETTMTKRELKLIRPWNDRPTFIGQPDEKTQRVPLYIHETYQLQAHRRSVGVKENGSREIITVGDREWFLEALAVATTYMEKTKKMLAAKVMTGEEGLIMMNAFVESERWLGIAKMTPAFWP